MHMVNGALRGYQATRRCALLVLLGTYLIGTCSCMTLDQMHRDSLRYGAKTRGHERYRLPSEMDSLTAGELASEASLRRYRRHRAAAGNPTEYRPEFEEMAGMQPTRSCVWYSPTESLGGSGFWECRNTTLPGLPPGMNANQGANRNGSGPPSGCSDAACSDDGQSDQPWTVIDNSKSFLQQFRSQPSGWIDARQTQPRLGQMSPAAAEAADDPPADAPATGRWNDMDWVWSARVLNASRSVRTTELEEGKVLVEAEIPADLIRALSSTASIAQMRDLLTEPSFAHMLPLERTVELGCLPPPESAAYTAISELAGAFEVQQQQSQSSGSGEFNQAFASSVTKLFEETERTVFLQYALFRLCEMSINAPSEFSNVYPVIIHDMVRRSAEMNEWVEYQKTKQLELELALLKAKESFAKVGQATPTPTATASKPPEVAAPTKSPTPPPAQTPTHTKAPTQTSMQSKTAGTTPVG